MGIEIIPTEYHFQSGTTSLENLCRNGLKTCRNGSDVSPLMIRSGGDISGSTAIAHVPALFSFFVMPYTFQTLPFNANSLSFSPYNDSLLAITSSQNFGLVGNGRTHILNITPNGIKLINKFSLADALLTLRFDTQDGLYDCAWSEVHENQLVTASGDGSIKLFDVTLKVTGPPTVHMT